MRAVIQRVSEASVVVEDEKFANIQQGLLVLLGIEIEDTKKMQTGLQIRFLLSEFSQIQKGK